MKFFCFNSVKELSTAQLMMYIERLVRCEVKLTCFKSRDALRHINMFKAVEKTITMFNDSLDEYLDTAKASVKLNPAQVGLLFADYVTDSDQRDAVAESYRTGACDNEVSQGVEDLPMTAKKVLVRMKREIDVKVQIRVQALAVQLRVKEKEAADAQLEAAALAAAADAKVARLSAKMTASAEPKSSAAGNALLSPGSPDLTPALSGLPKTPVVPAVEQKYPTPMGDSETQQEDYMFDCANIFIHNTHIRLQKYDARLRSTEEVKTKPSPDGGTALDASLAGTEGLVGQLLDA